MSEHVRHIGAWGDEPGDTLPPPLAAPLPLPEPTLPPALPSAPSDNEIVSGQLSHALVLALQDEKPVVGGWGMLAKRLGIHSSLLQRLRAGTGNISSVDEVAGKLGWRIVIRRPRG